MDKNQEQLETLREIRSLMERSSRFISLSGLSGVIAGVAATAGVVAAYFFLDIPFSEPAYYRLFTGADGLPDLAVIKFLLLDAAMVLTIALLAAGILATRKAKQQNQQVWDGIAKRMVINMVIPLAAGAVYCCILAFHGHPELIVPATMIFYGMGLLNAGKYTLDDIRYLGILQIAAGLLASMAPGYGLLIWAFGFGLLHMVYGITVYYKYEK